MTPKIRISNIVYLRKPVKDYQKPFRFTLTLWWTDEKGQDHGGDILGCLGGVGRDGRKEWNGPCFWIGKKVAYSFHIAPGTYEAVLGALTKGGYFKTVAEDLGIADIEKKLPPETSEEKYGLPGQIDVD